MALSKAIQSVHNLAKYPQPILSFYILMYEIFLVLSFFFNTKKKGFVIRAILPVLIRNQSMNVG